MTIDEMDRDVSPLNDSSGVNQQDSSSGIQKELEQ